MARALIAGAAQPVLKGLQLTPLLMEEKTPVPPELLLTTPQKIFVPLKANAETEALPGKPVEEPFHDVPLLVV